REMRKANHPGRRALQFNPFQKCNPFLIETFALLVRVRRIKPETVVLEVEVAARLGDAAFAKNDRLLTVGEAMADHSPFFERVLQHVVGLLGISSGIRKNSASGRWLLFDHPDRQHTRAPPPLPGALTSRS